MNTFSPSQTPTPSNSFISLDPSAQARELMLEEVDFKWLMAGLGWWIDTERLHSDPNYAAHWLDLVQNTAPFALQDCAKLLRMQMTH